MIGVNTFSASAVTMVNRRPVDYAKAVKRYKVLVPVDEANTVDPAVEPRGKRYDFSDNLSCREFFEDNFQNEDELPYLIGATNNKSRKFKAVNEVAFNIIRIFGKNPMLGFWHEDNPMPDGRILPPCKDTSFVESTADEEEAKRMATVLGQTEIVKCQPNSKFDFIKIIKSLGDA